MRISARLLTHPSDPYVHNWTHCSGRFFLSVKDGLNCRTAADSSPAAGRGPAPEKCTLSSVTVKALHKVHHVDGGGSAAGEDEICVNWCLTAACVCMRVYVFKSLKEQACWVIALE